MLALGTRRHAIGGALVAAAIVAKIFPAILLVPLAAQRRWKALAWTAGFGVAYTLLTLAVLGPAPFEAFFHYHLPRLASGAAFAFGDAWPEFAAPLAAGNLSPAGLVTKLALLGVPGAGDGLRTVLNGIYTIALVGLGVVAARRGGSRARSAQIWIALVGLASLRSPGAWGDYVPVTSLWLLTFLAAEMAGTRRRAVGLGVCWAFLFFLPGVLPTPVFPPMGVTMALSITGFALMLGLGAWAIGRRAPHPVRS
jgi:hypothetical protein